MPAAWSSLDASSRARSKPKQIFDLKTRRKGKKKKKKKNQFFSFSQTTSQQQQKNKNLRANSRAINQWLTCFGDGFGRACARLEKQRTHRRSSGQQYHKNRR
jgi:hypothetical protein